MNRSRKIVSTVVRDVILKQSSGSLEDRQRRNDEKRSEGSHSGFSAEDELVYKQYLLTLTYLYSRNACGQRSSQ